jgi:hypothetical protein
MTGNGYPHCSGKGEDGQGEGKEWKAKSRQSTADSEELWYDQFPIPRVFCVRVAVKGVKEEERVELTAKRCL